MRSGIDHSPEMCEIQSIRVVANLIFFSLNTRHTICLADSEKLYFKSISCCETSSNF
ncbi:hypothetical protein AGR7B_Lc160005 [Agrobacterium deltaense RV3]|nr:hypothetical protein AGR7B_Lc160005 [Agrobacterium deltaense RV3]